MRKSNRLLALWLAFLLTLSGVVVKVKDGAYLPQSLERDVLDSLVYGGHRYFLVRDGDVEEWRGVAEYVEPVYPLYPLSTEPNDPLFSRQWYLGEGGADLVDAWEVWTGAENPVVVAVLDTGIDLSHPEFVGRLASWGQDPVDQKDSDPFPDDEDGHGTCCAGIIGACANNGEGVAGINWGVLLLPVKIEFTSWGFAEGMKYVLSRSDVRVVSISLGGYFQSSLMADFCRYARDKGLLLVAAAGNDGENTPMYPAAYPTVMGVGAVDKDGERTIFSNYGSFVDISAPGVDLVTTDILGFSGFSMDDYYERFSGTSAAAPVVAGVASLLFSMHPDWTAEDVWERLCETADPVKGSHAEGMGCGIVNAAAALGLTSEKTVEFTSSPGYLRSPVVLSTSFSFPFPGARTFAGDGWSVVAEDGGAIVHARDGEEVEVRIGGRRDEIVLSRSAPVQTYLFYFPTEPVPPEFELRCTGIGDEFALTVDGEEVKGSQKCDFLLSLSPGDHRLTVAAVSEGQPLQWVSSDVHVLRYTPTLLWVRPSEVLGGFVRGTNRVLVEATRNVNAVDFHYRTCGAEKFSTLRMGRYEPVPSYYYTDVDLSGDCVEVYLSYFSDGVEVELPVHEERVIERGDVDGDGAITPDDLNLEEVLFGTEREWTTVYSENKDADGNGLVDERDLLKLALEVFR